jgi:hypothetical protein
MFEAIASSYYSVGVNIIDEEAYRKCFTDLITESNAVFDREKRRYVESVERNVERQQAALSTFESSYHNTPDLEKPHFVAQMAWARAREAERRAR